MAEEFDPFLGASKFLRPDPGDDGQFEYCPEWTLVKDEQPSQLSLSPSTSEQSWWQNTFIPIAQIEPLRWSVDEQGPLPDSSVEAVTISNSPSTHVNQYPELSLSHYPATAFYSTLESEPFIDDHVASFGTLDLSSMDAQTYWCRSDGLVYNPAQPFNDVCFGNELSPSKEEPDKPIKQISPIESDVLAAAYSKSPPEEAKRKRIRRTFKPTEKGRNQYGRKGIRRCAMCRKWRQKVDRFIMEG